MECVGRLISILDIRIRGGIRVEDNKMVISNGIKEVQVYVIQVS